MIAEKKEFRALDELVLQLKGLVLVRELLRKRGVSAEELDAHGAEIDRVRMRLAELVQNG